MKPIVHPDAMMRLIEWLFADDTGVSSKSMAAIALGVPKRDCFGYSAPHDPADFGRCYRLVLAVPEIIDAFPAIARRIPKFAGILKNWGELCALYERDKTTGRSDDLYDRIQELRGEAPRARRAA